MRFFYLTTALTLLAGWNRVFGQATFYYTGAAQTYIVPAGTDSIVIKAWGGGGGGGGSDDYGGGDGGGGAYASYTMAVCPGHVFTIYVASGGSGGLGCESDASGGTGGYGYGTGGTGGIAGVHGCSGGGGGGGGSTAVFDSTTSTLVLVAAGGGGGGGGGQFSNGGAAGGGGQDGTTTHGLGGQAGANNNQNGGAGQNMVGDGGGGGGGGAGDNGGTGGGAPNSDDGAGGGAGGSSLGIAAINGNGQAPGNSTDTNLCLNCAKGGTGDDNTNNSIAPSGGNGVVVIIAISGGKTFATQISPGDTTVCAGSSVALNATGGTIFSWNPAAGLSSSTISNPVANATATTTYYVTISNGACINEDSSVITINPGGVGVAGNVTPGLDNVCLGGNAEFAVTGSSGDIQWQSSPDGITFTDISGAITDSLTVSNLTQSAYYRVVASGACVSDTASSPAIVNIAPLPAAGNITAYPDSVCSGNSSSLTVAGSLGHIQWQSSPDAISFADIQGASAAGYNTPILNQTTYYRIMASNGCGVDSSSAASVIVMQQPTAGNITSSVDTICPATVANLFLQDNSGTPQWQSSGNPSGGFSIIRGTTMNQYSPLLSKTTYYRVVVNNSICSDTSGIYEEVVAQPPVASFTNTVSGHTVYFNSDSSKETDSYYWNFGDNNTSSQANPTHTYATADTFDVCLTVHNKTNCNSTLCYNVTIYPTGINNITNSGGCIIFPNPFNNQILIETGSLNGKVTGIEIYDLLGRRVFDNNPADVLSNPISLDVSSLAKGMYYLRITVNGINYNQKMIKQ